MSLGKGARYRQEALDLGVLIFMSEKRFYDAVVDSNEAAIARIGGLLKSDKFPHGGATEQTYSVWHGSIKTFCNLPSDALIVHWEADKDHLHWGVTAGEFLLAREEEDEFGQQCYIFYRPLDGGWRKSSIDDIPLSNLHPKARDISINMATLNRVRTDHGYLRNLILDRDTGEWESRQDWQAKAREKRSTR